MNLIFFSLYLYLSLYFFTMTTPLQGAQECLVPPSYMVIIVQVTSSEPQFRVLPNQSFSLSSLLSNTGLKWESFCHLFNFSSSPFIFHSIPSCCLNPRLWPSDSSWPFYLTCSIDLGSCPSWWFVDWLFHPTQLPRILFQVLRKCQGDRK